MVSLWSQSPGSLNVSHFTSQHCFSGAWADESTEYLAFLLPHTFPKDVG